jgi:23S rRNA (uracil1939-C5)-methyltransferase
MVPGGDGLARLSDGRIAFARGAFPGDVIEPQRVEVHESWVRAQSWRLVVAGPHRVRAPCPFAARCGGCDWMELDRSAQLRAKASILREALQRIGGFRDLPAELPVISAGSDLGYRNRLRLHLDDKATLGMFGHHSREIVEIPACLVCHPAINQALAQLREVFARHRKAISACAEVEIRVTTQRARPLVSLTSRNSRPIAAALLEELQLYFDVALDGRGIEEIEQTFMLPGGVELLAPVQAFTQINWCVNLELVRALVEGAVSRGARSFLDLYSGAGNLGLPLLAAGLHGLGIERSRAAVAAAEKAARRAKLAGHFEAGDVSTWLGRLAGSGAGFDLVVVDPPRSGAQAALAGVVALEPSWIAMCACDPATLARDLAILRRSGYALEGAQVFDMFPHTHHLEALAWMKAPVRGL